MNSRNPGFAFDGHSSLEMTLNPTQAYLKITQITLTTRAYRFWDSAKTFCSSLLLLMHVDNATKDLWVPHPGAIIFVDDMMFTNQPNKAKPSKTMCSNHYSSPWWGPSEDSSKTSALSYVKYLPMLMLLSWLKKLEFAKKWLLKCKLDYEL